MSGSRRPSFEEVQRRFAAHIRDPEANPPPEDVSARRMAVYTELFYRNIEQLLAEGFPVLRRICPDAQWHRLVRSFMAHHRSLTPLFPRVGQEFVDFLEAGEDQGTAPAYFAELARYERLEVDVALADAEDVDPVAVAPGSSLLDQRLALSRSARPMEFAYPVHRISPDYKPEVPPETPTWLLVYRAHDGRVRFMELNAFSYTLLHCLQLAPDALAHETLRSVARAIGHPREGEVISAGEEFLQMLVDRGIVIASR
jgi:uncharacterized protein